MRKGDWIQTYRGIRIYPLDPRPEEIDIEDIAHSLSMQARFNGHLRQFVSVAEHCCRICDLLPGPLKLAGLLHDASEAYLCDLPRPLKKTGDFATGYRAAEDALMEVIAARYGFAYPLDPDVAAVDRAMTKTEAALLLGPVTDWDDDSEVIPGLEAYCWAPMQARYEFLRRFHALTSGAGDDWSAEDILRRAG